MQRSLRQICKGRFEDLFESMKREMLTGSFLLIVDEHTSKVLSPCIKMHEIVKFGILGLELLQKKRKPYRSVQALYFISPRQQSIKYLCQDFDSVQQYAAVHILFSSKCPKPLLKRIVDCSKLYSLLKSCKESNLDFMFWLDRHFQLCVQEDVRVVSWPGSREFESTMERVVQKLLALCTSFSKVYSFQIIFNSSSNKIAQHLSLSLYTKLDQFIKNALEKRLDLVDRTAKKVNLIILDRPFDPLAPLLHDINYQPFMYDLLNVRQDSVSLLKGPFVLDEGDQIFMKFKNFHISKALKEIPEEMNEFSQKNKAASMQAGKSQGQSLNKVMQDLNQFSIKTKLYSNHYQISQAIIKVYNERKIQQLLDIEQTLVTGLDKAGKQVDGSKLLSRISVYLNDPNLRITTEDRARLIAITFCVYNLSDSDAKELLKLLGTSQYVTSIKNLREMVGGQPTDKSKRKQNYYKESKSALGFERHLLKVPQFVRSFLKGELQGGKSRKLNCQQKSGGVFKAKLSKDKVSEETILFVVGGVGVNELSRCPREVTSGGTMIYSPSDYLKALGFKKQRSRVEEG